MKTPNLTQIYAPTCESYFVQVPYKDQTEKLALYERHAVKGYWIFNPDAKYVLAYCFEGKKYGKPEYLTESDTLKSTVLEGLKIDLSDIWGNK